MKKIIILAAFGAIGLLYLSRSQAAPVTGSGVASSVDTFGGALSIVGSMLPQAVSSFRNFDITSYVYKPGNLPAYDQGLSPLDNLNIAAAYQQNSSVENERQSGSAASKAALGAASKYYLAVADRVGAAVEARLDYRMYPPGGSPSWRRNYSNQVLSLYRAEAAPSGGFGGLGGLLTFQNAATVAKYAA